MRWGFIWACIVVLSAFAAHFLVDQRGFVLLSIADTRITTSLPIFILGLFILYVLVRLLLKTIRAPKRIKAHLVEHKRKTAHALFEKGSQEMCLGRWQRSERLLIKSAKRSGHSLLAYLGAARAAHSQHAIERRDGWLKLASEKNPAAQSSVLFTQAELHIDSGEYDKAITTLNLIEEKTPGYDKSLVLLARIHDELNDWSALEALLPKLRKSKMVSKAHYAEVASDVWQARFGQVQDGDQDAAFKAAWKKLPMQVRKQPKLMASYAEALAASMGADEAERFVRRQLNKEWSDELIGMYAMIQTQDASKQLKQAEKFISSQPDNYALHQALAVLSMRNELWGKAQSYLETALSQQPTVEGYRLLGELAEQLSQHEKSMQAYRSGLDLALTKS